jgi:hypothetical protein
MPAAALFLDSDSLILISLEVKIALYANSSWLAELVFWFNWSVRRMIWSV